MKLIKNGMLFLSILLTNALQAQELSNTKYNKLSAGLFQSMTDAGIRNRLTGIDIEYYRNLNRWYGVALGFEAARFNNIPRDKDTYKNARGLVASSLIAGTDDLTLNNETATQAIFSAHFYFTPINNQKCFLYISNGFGYNIQDVVYQASEQYLFREQNNEIKSGYAIVYKPVNTQTIVYLATVGCDFRMKKNWFVGANLRVQLPVIIDRYHTIVNYPYNDGFNSLFRLGFRVGKSF